MADVPGREAAGTCAGSLPALANAVREVTVRAADLPDEAMARLALGHRYQTGAPELDASPR
jgi:hypothetical protein